MSILAGKASAAIASDLHQRLASCIAHINAHHADAALCVFTGDLTDTGAPESYADLRAALNGLSGPWRLLPGNHDRRGNPIAAFPEIPVDEHGFIQSTYQTADEVLLFLNCLAEGRIEGELRQAACVARSPARRSSRQARLHLAPSAGRARPAAARSAGA